MKKEEILDFLLSLKEGNFFVVERKENVEPDDMPRFTGKMIICFEGNFVENSDGDNWHSADSKFMINLVNELRIRQNFGIDAIHNNVRKASISEIFTLIERIHRSGYVYNRKSMKLTKINP